MLGSLMRIWSVWRVIVFLAKGIFCAYMLHQVFLGHERGRKPAAKESWQD